jgi:hypothetical protein
MERMQAALADLARIDAGAAAGVPEWQGRVAEIEESERRWAARALGEGAERMVEREPNGHGQQPAWLARAKALYPCRCGPGPIDVAMILRAERPELMPRLWELYERMGPVAHNYEPVLQYWSDGTRSVAEIGELADLELDHPADENTLAYFELLAEIGQVRLDAQPAVARAGAGGAGA